MKLGKVAKLCKAQLNITIVNMSRGEGKATQWIGEVPKGCWRCERMTSQPYAGAMWIRHDGARHYIVFTDASGNSTEYRIWFCPLCGKKF